MLELTEVDKERDGYERDRLVFLHHFPAPFDLPDILLALVIIGVQEHLKLIE
jgi:hypothetical protein